MTTEDQLPLALPESDLASRRLALLPAQWLSEWGVFPPAAHRTEQVATGRPIVTEFYEGTPQAYTLEIGGFNLMGEVDLNTDVRNNPSWTIDHLRVFVALLTFVSKTYYQPPVDVSWRSLYVRMGMPETPNHKTRSYWKDIATDVLVTSYRVRRSKASEIVTESIATNQFVKLLFGDGKTVMGETIRGLCFRPEFLAALWPGVERGDRTQVRDLDQTSFAGLKLPLSRQLYLVLGREAAFRTEDKPYHCGLKTLLANCGIGDQRVGAPVLRLRTVCGRDKASGAVAELEKIPLLNGRLRVRVRKNAAWLRSDGNPADWDYVLEAWCEGRVAGRSEAQHAVATHESRGVLAAATRLPSADYRQLCRHAGNRLEEHDVNLLTAAGFSDWNESVLFLARAKEFLGVSVFHEEIGDTKMHADSGRPFSQNPSARIIDNLMRAVKRKAEKEAARRAPETSSSRTLAASPSS